MCYFGLHSEQIKIGVAVEGYAAALGLGDLGGLHIAVDPKLGVLREVFAGGEFHRLGHCTGAVGFGVRKEELSGSAAQTAVSEHRRCAVSKAKVCLLRLEVAVLAAALAFVASFNAFAARALPMA